MQVLFRVSTASTTRRKAAGHRPSEANLTSSFFYKHPLLAKYEWYWRLEPEIKYFCDIT